MTSPPEDAQPADAQPGDALLAGFTVGITADRRWQEQADLLGRRGASVIHGPTILTVPLRSQDALRAATLEVLAHPPDIVIANTGIGMRSWFDAADRWGKGAELLATLSNARIYARGPKVSAAVHKAGLAVTAKAASERMAEVIELVLASGAAGARIVFQRHGDEAPEMLAPLLAAGAIVLEIPVYQWIVPDDAQPAIRLAEAVAAGAVDAVTFTSAPAVHNFLALAGEVGLAGAVLDRLNNGVLTACVGPVCAGAAIEEGIAAPIVPDRARLGPMIRELADRLVQSRGAE